MKISACLIVKNEAENIRRCLDSINGVSVEIILVDTGSEDNTVEIALNYGAKVYNYQWDNNFSNARNFSINKVTRDWIICLDADQYLEENTQKNLKSALMRINNNMNIDSVICKEISTDGFDGKFITEIPTIRIFRGNCKIRYKGAIHEKPLNDGDPLNPVNLSDISLIIYHTGYTSDELITKAERNLKILKQLVDNNTKDNLTYYYISISYNNLNNHEEAIKYALLALDEPNFNGTILAHQPYTILIHNMLKLKDKYLNGDIEKYVAMAINLFPAHPEVWYSRAQVKTE